MNLTIDSIDLQRQVVIVNGKSGERYVRIGNTSAKALWKYFAVRSQFNDNNRALWLSKRGNKLSNNALDGLLRVLGKNIGTHLHAHLLRHTGATLFLKNGGSPFECQYFLGHQSLEMTKRYCQSLGFEEAYKAHVKASPIDNLSEEYLNIE